MIKWNGREDYDEGGLGVVFVMTALLCSALLCP